MKALHAFTKRRACMKGITLYLCLMASMYSHNLPQADAQKLPRRGILLLAHGGRLLEWNEEVRHVADRVDLVMPTEVAFGMATRSTIEQGIKNLAARKVTEIIAVPLFVSSHSSVIDSTAYLLGLRPDMPADLKTFASMNHGSGSMDHHQMQHDASQAEQETKPVSSLVPIRMAPALNHHAIVAGILMDRAASISKDPAREVIVLVAHGPVPDEENKLWLNDMNLLAGEMRQQTHYAGIESLTLRDDADDPIRSDATKQLRATVEKINDAHQTALVVPLLLSFGGIEDGLRKRLAGLSYQMPSQGLLPDTRIVEWVLQSARNVTTPFP